MCAHWDGSILVFANRRTICDPLPNLPVFWVAICHGVRHLPFCDVCKRQHFCQDDESDYYTNTDDYDEAKAAFYRAEAQILGRAP